MCLVHSLEEKSGTIKDPNLPRHTSKSNQVESAAVVNTVYCDRILYFFLSLLLKVLLTLFLDFPMAFVATALLGLTCVSELIQLLGEVRTHKLHFPFVPFDWHFDLVVPLQFALVLDAVEQLDVALVTSHN